MVDSSMKAKWKRFNEAVNNFARCDLCARRFEHKVHMCSKIHNICSSCYNPTLTNEVCGLSGCTGVWLSEDCTNLVLSQLSVLRTSLYASRSEISKLDSEPWLELVQCSLCYEVQKEVFMCQFGHNWCGSCEEQLCRLVRNGKCPYCNSVLMHGSRHNVLVEKIVKGLLRTRSDSQGVSQGPVWRTGKFRCPATDCPQLLCLQMIYAHLKSDHPQHYIIREKNQFDSEGWYEVMTLKAPVFKGALKIERVGLFGLCFEFVSYRPGRQVLEKANITYLSGFARAFRYEMRLRHTTIQNRAIDLTPWHGIISIEDSPDIDREKTMNLRTFLPLTIWVKLTPM